VAQQCLALATKEEHRGMTALANRLMGWTLYSMGAFVEGRAYLKRTLDLCAIGEESIVSSNRSYGTDDQVTALSQLSVALLLLGYPEQAAAASTQACVIARGIGQRFTIALALHEQVLSEIIVGNLQQNGSHADEELAHSVEHRMPDYEFWARLNKGALLTQGGDPQRGVELMQSAMTTADRIRHRPRHLAHLAAAYRSLGEPNV
jgi:hypothetical protein